MVDVPLVDSTNASEMLSLAQTKVREITQGKLSDFSPASPVTAILEAVVLVNQLTQDKVNKLTTELEKNRINSLGISRNEGNEAIGSIKVTLDALYSQTFILPKNFKLNVNSVPFSTVSELVINAFQDSSTVSIICDEPGTLGNLPKSATITYTPVNKIASISLIDETNNGSNPDSDTTWQEKIYQTLRRRDTLISTDDFEDEVRNFLGYDSTVIAVGKLKPDRTTYANGYVSVFGINANGTPLNDAQLAQLNSYLNSKAAMATVSVFSMNLINVNTKIIATYESGSAPEAVANQLNQVVKDFFKPGILTPGELILNKSLEYRIQQLSVIKEGLVSVMFNGLAQPLALPNSWSIGVYKNLSVTVNDGNRNFDYNF